MNTKLYKNQKHTLYELQKQLDLSINTLYNYARGRTDIGKMQVDMLINIARLEHKEPMELYYEMREYLDENRFR